MPATKQQERHERAEIRRQLSRRMPGEGLSLEVRQANSHLAPMKQTNKRRFFPHSPADETCFGHLLNFRSGEKSRSANLIMTSGHSGIYAI